MEDDKLRNLFNDFQPELSSSSQFMTKLQKNMEMVEILKQHDIALKKRNKLAVVIAAVSGFVMGVILTLLFPLITNWVSTFSVSLPHLHISNLTIDYSFVSWIVMAGVCIITALNAYEIALAKLASKETISI
jgi:type II secretory pathway component PulF